MVGLATWLHEHVPARYGLHELEPCVLADQVLCELAVVEKRMGGGDVDRGCAEEGGKSLQAEEAASSSTPAPPKHSSTKAVDRSMPLQSFGALQQLPALPQL